MFQVGERVRGFEYDYLTDKRKEVEGSVIGRTMDPEEYIQDIIIVTDDDRFVYLPENSDIIEIVEYG